MSPLPEVIIALLSPFAPLFTKPVPGARTSVAGWSVVMPWAAPSSC